MGSRGTPTTVVSEGDRKDIVIGFDRTRLAALLGV